MLPTKARSLPGIYPPPKPPCRVYGTPYPQGVAKFGANLQFFKQNDVFAPLAGPLAAPATADVALAPLWASTCLQNCQQAPATRVFCVFDVPKTISNSRAIWGSPAGHRALCPSAIGPNVANPICAPPGPWLGPHFTLLYFTLGTPPPLIGISDRWVEWPDSGPAGTCAVISLVFLFVST